MRIFQSDNIWKKAARKKKQAEHPETPEQAHRAQLTSTALWLTGGMVIFALLLTAVRAGALPLNGENGVILAVVGLYTLYNAAALGRLWRDRPGRR